MEQQGFGGLAAPPPALCQAATGAVHCWRWCKGWMPERWAAYAALHEVEDWAMTMDLLEHLRDIT